MEDVQYSLCFNSSRTPWWWFVRSSIYYNPHNELTWDLKKKEKNHPFVVSNTFKFQNIPCVLWPNKFHPRGFMQIFSISFIKGFVLQERCKRTWGAILLWQNEAYSSLFDLFLWNPTCSIVGYPTALAGPTLNIFLGTIFLSKIQSTIMPLPRGLPLA